MLPLVAHWSYRGALSSEERDKVRKGLNVGRPEPLLQWCCSIWIPRTGQKQDQLTSSAASAGLDPYRASLTSPERGGLLQTQVFCQAWWIRLVIPATQEAEARELQCQGLPGIQSKSKYSLSNSLKSCLKNKSYVDGRDGSVVKSLIRGTRFGSQHPWDSLQSSTTPVLGDLIPSSDGYGYQAHTFCTNTHTGKIPIHIK